MPIGAHQSSVVDGFWRDLELLESVVRKSQARDITATATRENVRSFVKHYFAEVRPIWEACNLAVDHIEITDGYSQDLLLLANAKNRRLSYLKALKAIKARRPAIEAELARYRPTEVIAPPSGPSFSDIEKRILETLAELLPTAALSYKQVIVDLQSRRWSYRGTAVELRETLRETLDHLAPDSEVMQQSSFKLENGLAKPTMKQKAHFVLRARGSASNAMNAAKDSVLLTDALVAQSARSVYEKGSISTHVATSKDEVMRVKQYTDAVLIELLQLSLD